MTEEEIKALNEEVAKLRQEKTELAGEIAARDNRISVAEQAMSSRDNELAELKAQLGKLNGEFANAITGYRALAVTANPDIPAELITGDNIGAIDRAVAGARSLIGKVKEQLEKAVGQVRVPPGAPQRTPPDLSGLSPREKINAGISKATSN